MDNKTLALLLLLLISGPATDAQPYWVIETNVHQKNFTIIKFFDEHNLMLHEQKLEGVYFDLSKKRTVRKLDWMLQHYLSDRSMAMKKEAKRKNARRLAW